MATTGDGQPVRVLHLSDMHFRTAKSWDADPVLRALTDFVGRRVEAKGPPDLVAITGDLAFSGKADEYRLARAWLDQLWAKLGSPPKDRLLLVPGNHDVDRDKVGFTAEAAQERMLKKGLNPSKSQQQIATVLSNDGERNVLLNRHSAYFAFAAEWFGAARSLPWWQRVIDINGVRLHVAGLDSAWMACSDEDSQRLLLGRYQLTQTVETAAANGADWRLALVHHPWEDLAEFDRHAARDTVHQHCDLLLRGHLHHPHPEHIRQPERNCLELPTGCVYETSQYPNAFQWIELSPPPAKRVRVRFFLWHESAWKVDKLHGNDGWWEVDLQDSSKIPEPPKSYQQTWQLDMNLETALPGILKKPGEESNGLPHAIRSTDGKLMLLIRPKHNPSFYVDKYPVTARQYSLFLRMFNGDDQRKWRNYWARWPGSDDFPVTNVSPKDAKAYASWFGKRLPTLNEWRIIASGGIEPFPLYPWGHEFEEGRCNSAEYWEVHRRESVSKKAEPTIVTKFKPQNEAGVCDIVGNIYEIVVAETGHGYLLTGGFYECYKADLQVFRNHYDSFHQATRNIGFRCVANYSFVD